MKKIEDNLTDTNKMQCLALANYEIYHNLPNGTARLD